MSSKQLPLFLCKIRSFRNITSPRRRLPHGHQPQLVTNLQTLVRCFFHNPPTFKVNVPLSWLPSLMVPTATAAGAAVVTTTSVGSKRPAPLDAVGDGLVAKKDMPRYTPPVGRWSSGGGRNNEVGRGRNTRGNQRRGRARNWY